jgi:hypothetical protein
LCASARLNSIVAFLSLCLFLISQVTDSATTFVLRQLNEPAAVDPAPRLMKIYVGLAVSSFFLDWIRIRTVLLRGVSAAQKVYICFFARVKAARLPWLESIPPSRLLQRVSTDQSVMDMALPARITFLGTDFTFALVDGALVSCFVPVFLIPTAFYTAIVVYLLKCYTLVVQDVKRVE